MRLLGIFGKSRSDLEGAEKKYDEAIQRCGNLLNSINAEFVAQVERRELFFKMWDSPSPNGRPAVREPVGHKSYSSHPPRSLRRALIRYLQKATLGGLEGDGVAAGLSDPFLEIKLAFSRVVSAAKSYYVEDTAEYENLLKKFSSTLATTKSPKMEPLAAS